MADDHVLSRVPEWIQSHFSNDIIYEIFFTLKGF